MIRKLLIANRGEIACRITRTCRRLGIAVVAVYSDADASALHVSLADEAVHIGAGPAADSYLRVDKLIEAARRTGADALHPGYGFLSENADFAQSVVDAGLTWIGPPPAAIRAMGKKREAKQLLQNIPLVPGYQGEDQSDDALITAANSIGFPVMVKASAGGGGKGMRRVDTADALPEALAAARREARQAFGDDTLILEKYLVNPRHIEIQVFGDTHGSVIALGERECSIQRRHQKIIEEAPSVALDDALRQRMAEVAVQIGRQLGYTSAGTIEFLLDEHRNFYFMEMNTRLQVEHPVTELVYGCDLVEWQIAVAEGAALSDLTPATPIPLGHAIEVRLYAEDPQQAFLPASGDVLYFDTRTLPPSLPIRLDTGVQSGDTVSLFYDPMLAKVIAYSSRNREEAARLLHYALGQLPLLGIRSNIGFLRRVLAHPDFVAGALHTHFIDAHPELLEPETQFSASALIAAAVARTHHDRAAGQAPVGHWRNSPFRPIRQSFTAQEARFDIHLTPRDVGIYTVTITGAVGRLLHQNGKSLDIEQAFDVRFSLESDAQMVLTVDGHRQRVVVAFQETAWWVHQGGHTYRFTWQTPLPQGSKLQVTEGSLRAPMTGQIIQVRVVTGQAVRKGDHLMSLEAMKMEHRIQAPHDGIVGKIHHQVGDSVQADAVLLEVQLGTSENSPPLNP